MRLRRRTVTVAADVAEYVQCIKPLFPGFESLWTGIIWNLEHRADQIGEPFLGNTQIAKVKLNPQLSPVTILFKLSEDTAHVLAFEWSAELDSR